MDNEEMTLQQHESRSQHRYEELRNTLRRLEEEMRATSGAAHQAARTGRSQQHEGWTESMTANQHQSRLVGQMDDRLRRLEESVYRLTDQLRGGEGMQRGVNGGGGGDPAQRGRELPYYTGGRDIPRQSWGGYQYPELYYAPGVAYLPYPM